MPWCFAFVCSLQRLSGSIVCLEEGMMRNESTDSYYCVTEFTSFWSPHSFLLLFPVATHGYAHSRTLTDTHSSDPPSHQSQGFLISYSDLTSESQHLSLPNPELSSTYLMSHAWPLSSQLQNVSPFPTLFYSHKHRSVHTHSRSSHLFRLEHWWKERTPLSSQPL